MLIYKQTQLFNLTEKTQFCTPFQPPALNLETVSRQRADAHWIVSDSTDQIVARCSLWWRHTPPYPHQQVGLVGHYAARNAEAAAQLLQLACNQLAGHGCTMVIGPMDGNTWQNYRLVTGRGREPRFFLEPDNPDDWPGHFLNNGFTILAPYFSTLNSNLRSQSPRLTKVINRAKRRGINIRPFNLDQFEEELRQIYNIAVASFSRNFLYTPLSQTDFYALYDPLRGHIRPELIQIAEHQGRAIGFIFALPDLRQAQRGQRIDTIIIKTVAVHPDYQTGGLGHLLVARCQKVANRLGYKRAIHALMYEKNDSRKISRRNQTETIRRYALFAKEI